MDSEQNISKGSSVLPVIDIFVGPIFTYLTPISETV